jgi:hypothetical protein
MTNNNQSITEEAIALAKFQQPRITAEDKAVLKVFKGRDDLLLALRDAMFGFDLDAGQQKLLKSIAKPEIQKALRKVFLPEISKENHVGQNGDYYKTQDIKEATPETFEHAWESKTTLLEMVEKALKRVKDPSRDGVDLKPARNLAKLTARNNFIDLVDAKIRDIVVFANQKEEETVEQALEKMRMNSSK